MDKIIKTVRWCDCGNDFTREVQKAFGRPQGGQPENFRQLVSNYPSHTTKAFQELFNGLMSRVENDPKATEEAVSIENSCLFYAEVNSATTLEIVMEHLKVINVIKSDVPSIWCYLDGEKKAVAHFVLRGTFYAELFCLYGGGDTSVLHIIETSCGNEFIPVSFVKDLSPFAHQADIRGALELREYFPRDLGSFLSKGRHRINDEHASESKSSKRRFIDNGDEL